MQQNFTHFLSEIQRRYFLVKSFVRRYWKRGLTIAFVLFIVIKKDIDIDLQLSGPNYDGQKAWLDFSGLQNPFRTLVDSDEKEPGLFSSTPTQPVNTSMLNQGGEAVTAEDNLANTFSNMVFSGQNIATSESERKRLIKRRKQEAYIKTYAAIAQREMKDHGIPASITLAQGLLESNAGESRLALRNNNHFGIKCFSRSCRKGHCSNFTDDHHKDFFRKYRNPRESFDAHSELLQSKRYRKLFKLSPKDYEGWARGLKAAGYATDRYYAEKLINLIENLQLYRFDR